MLPHQIRLPQPTLLCKATTERERREEITSRGPHPGGAVVVDSEVIEMHLRVHLRDFQGTSTAHLEVFKKNLNPAEWEFIEISDSNVGT